MQQVIVEVYRTNEDKSNYSFTSAVTISYFDDTAFVQGLSGNFSRKCWNEIINYLTEKGLKKMQYIRRGKLKEVWLQE